MAKVNKICKVCNTEYAYCPSCSHKEPSWKQLCCSEPCHDIWSTLSRNGVGKATAQETLEALDHIVMPKVLQPGIQAHIDRLWAEMEIITEPEVVIEEEVEMPFEEIIPIEEIEVVLDEEV